MKRKSALVSTLGLTTALLAGCLSLSPTATDWEVLFDGSSDQAQKNFRGYHQAGFPKGWGIDGDALKTMPEGEGADIMTRQMYSDFELNFEWASQGGEGGVFYHVVESANPPGQTGPEYQVLDDVKNADGKDPLTSAGALYDLIAPNTEKMTLAPGRFNESRIIFEHGHVEHWLNGHKILEYRWDSPPLHQLIARSIFSGFPGFMKADHGYIVFQNRGQAVWYRKIRIRRL